MAKPFDSTLKQILDDYAVDWIAWLAPSLGLPRDLSVEPVDADLSTVQVAADKVFRLKPPAAGLIHLEPQSSWDGELPDRLLLYNALLHHRHGGPVYSIAILLRPEANAATLTGTLVRCLTDGNEYHRFRYFVVRVWELRAEDLLSGGLGALPLALLTNDARGRIEELVERLDRRLREPDVAESDRRMILASSYILLGLRYTESVFHEAFQRVHAMKESSSYQYILKEGRQEGRQEGQIHALRETLLDILSDRFGQLPVELVAEISIASDPAQLRSAIRSGAKIAGLADFPAFRKLTGAAHFPFFQRPLYSAIRHGFPPASNSARSFGRLLGSGFQASRFARGPLHSTTCGEAAMAHRNKTNKSVKKRIRVTGTGKLKYSKCGKRHLNAHFTAKRRRQLRNAGVITSVIVEKYLIAMNEQ